MKKRSKKSENTTQTTEHQENIKAPESHSIVNTEIQVLKDANENIGKDLAEENPAEQPAENEAVIVVPIINNVAINQGGDHLPERFRFIDLFAGIGGFHYAMHEAGGDCVFASEWDRFSRVTYEHNFRNISPQLFANGNFNCDINEVDSIEKMNQIPDFDILCAGFPCQPFSMAGLRRGFDDIRGTLFFQIARIVQHKIDNGNAPRVLLLENVKGLRNHDRGNTLREIVRVLEEELHYNVRMEVLNAKHFGVPQNRERLFIVAWRDNPNEAPLNFIFPYGLDNEGIPIFEKQLLPMNAVRSFLGDILEENPDPRYTISDRLFTGHQRRRMEHAERGNGFGFTMFNTNSPYTSTISARYYKDGSEILIDQSPRNPRKLTPVEAGRLQGYNINVRADIPVSDVQAYKQFGNSVAVPVVKTLALEIVNQLLNHI